VAAYFITGGLGFMGQYIVRAVHEHDPRGRLRVLVRTRRPTFLRVESLDRLAWLEGDLLRPEAWEAGLEGVDTVIHNAAMVSFRRSEEDLIYRTNVVGTRNLVEAALRAGCRNFIFISSIAAVGVERGKVSDESMSPEPEALHHDSMYGYTKLLCEQHLMSVANRIRVIILNPSLVLGPGSDRIAMLTKAIRFLPVLPMPRFLHSFVDVRDFAQALVLSLTRGRSGERYIVTAHHADLLTVVRVALDVLGRRAWLVPVSGRGIAALEAVLWFIDVLGLNPGVRDVSRTNIDHEFSSDKIREEMGWVPQYSLEESIRASLVPAPD